MKNLHTVRRALMIAATLLAVVTPAMAVDTDDQLIDRVRQAVIKHKFFNRPDCMNYQIIRKVHPGVDEVDLREIHNPKCGGDPGTEPRLFDFLIDRKTGKMATTALDPDGLDFVRLQ